MQYSDAFRVPSGQMTSDRVLADWYEKGLGKLPVAGGSGGWSCEAWSRTESNMQFSVVWARRHGGSGGLPPTVAEDTFAMIARRSPDMKAIDSPESAGGGYGQGKVYQGENARVFVRVGSLGSVLYIVSVRGDASLDAGNQHLRAFFDGFEPIAR
jgi:hypothetical protein